MQAAVAGRLGVAGDPEFVQQRVHLVRPPRRTSSNEVPGLRIQVDAQFVGVGGSSARYGQRWRPRQPRLTAHSTWAVSATTRAFEVVPLGVLTTVVWSQSGAPAGTRFWKKDLPPAPPGNR